jgi:hypothetical protein
VTIESAIERRATPPARQTVTPRPIVAGAVILSAGVLTIIAAFLPWLTKAAWFMPDGHHFEPITQSGIDLGGDGIMAMAIGLIVALLGIALLSQRGKPLASRIGALICFPVLIWVGDLGVRSVDFSNEWTLHNEGLANAELGLGIWVVVGAAILILVGVFIPARDAS